MTKAADRRLRAWAVPVLEVWHGVFAGAYLVAFWTAEGNVGMHRTAGYLTLGLLVVRFLAATAAPAGSPLALPWATMRQWVGFVHSLSGRGARALGGRHPLIPLSGLLLLAAVTLVVFTGALMHGRGARELHESLGNISLGIVTVHVGLIVGARAIRRLAAHPAAASPSGRTS